jgi:uncharacterized membrane protein YgcG
MTATEVVVAGLSGATDLVGRATRVTAGLGLEDSTPSNDVNIGIYAFVTFVVLVITLWLLMRNMNARMRRMSYRRREEDAAAAEAEQAAVDRAAESSRGDGSRGDGSGRDGSAGGGGRAGR